MKIVLSPNPFRDKGLRTARLAQEILTSSGADCVLTLPFELEESHGVTLPQDVGVIPLEDALRGADLLVCFGGDGTILHAAKSANGRDIPILGINLGSVGFMAELEQSDLHLLEKLTAGEFTVERRMMLDVKVVRGGRVLFRNLALNDVVIAKGAVARVIDLAVTADQVLISEFIGDGIIICTPTGSTAYSMSAGGPIVEPTAENLIVTPICAHSLSAKSFVLDRARVVGVHIDRQSRKVAYLSADGGRAFKLLPGDRIEVSRSNRQTKLVRLSGRSFYEIVNHKLGRVKK